MNCQHCHPHSRSTAPFCIQCISQNAVIKRCWKCGCADFESCVFDGYLCAWLPTQENVPPLCTACAAKMIGSSHLSVLDRVAREYDIALVDDTERPAASHPRAIAEREAAANELVPPGAVIWCGGEPRGGTRALWVVMSVAVIAIAAVFWLWYGFVFLPRLEQ